MGLTGSTGDANWWSGFTSAARERSIGDQLDPAGERDRLAVARGELTGDRTVGRRGGAGGALEAGYLAAATLDASRAGDAAARIEVIEAAPAESLDPARRALLAQVLFAWT
ncbi:MAG: hypothetical protein ACR2OB_08690 [Solirubrobacteraceae bacterium]